MKKKNMVGGFFNGRAGMLNKYFFLYIWLKKKKYRETENEQIFMTRETRIELEIFNKNKSLISTKLRGNCDYIFYGCAFSFICNFQFGIRKGNQHMYKHSDKTGEYSRSFV